MLNRSLAGLVFVLALGGIVLADETRGTITKVEDGSITIRTGGFGKDKDKSEEKTFKLSGGVKISRTSYRDKDKEPVKLTIDELKVAVKVTNVFVTVTHEGDNGTEIKVGGGGFGAGKGKRKKKDDN